MGSCGNRNTYLSMPQSAILWSGAKIVERWAIYEKRIPFMERVKGIEPSS